MPPGVIFAAREIAEITALRYPTSLKTVAAPSITAVRVARALSACHCVDLPLIWLFGTKTFPPKLASES
ncbi:hypothetical protein GCM10010471_28480 [Leucobacter komagatae]